jgi:hypothetical protein
LPVLAVWFDEGYILIDGTSGAAAGPYDDGMTRVAEVLRVTAEH